MTARDGPDAPGVLEALGVDKCFYLFDDGDVWRLMLGQTPPAPTVTALSGVSLSLPKGGMVGVLGRNGAGKSTLLRALGGVYGVSAGQVRRSGTLSAIYELGAGAHALGSGRTYVRRYLILHEVPRSQWAAILDEVAAFSELGRRMDHPLFTYSEGMRARLFFATATSLRHDIYLIDEVLAVGDQAFRDKCWARLRQRRAEGTSALLVSHDWESVLRLCETAHLLDQGRLVCSGAAEEVVRTYLRDEELERRNDVACFDPGMASVFPVESGGELRILIPFTVHRLPAPVRLSYSIDHFGADHGWEILLAAADQLVAERPGRHVAELFLAALPLNPGEYNLNLTLVFRDETGQRRICDRRSRLFDANAPVLRVGGRGTGTGVCRMPCHWEVVHDGGC